MKPSFASSNSSPLTEATYFILLSLSPGPTHGYAIMKDVQELSEGRVRLSTGTLYGALKRLLEINWIERDEEPFVIDSARDRKAYRLTDLGAGVLQAEVERLNRLVAAAGAKAYLNKPKDYTP